jgi:hypothetical protein
MQIASDFITLSARNHNILVVPDPAIRLWNHMVSGHGVAGDGSTLIEVVVRHAVTAVATAVILFSGEENNFHHVQVSPL